MRNKIVPMSAAADMIHSGCTLASTGFSVAGVAEEVLETVAERFRTTGQPRDLTVLHAAGQGDWRGNGLDRLGFEGLIRRIIGGHFSSSPKIGALIGENRIQAYNFPQGVMVHLYQAIARREVGEITKVGLGTFLDPRLSGGRMNSGTRDDLIQLVQLEGQEWMLYPSMKIDVAVMRGTTADEIGNITMEDEAMFLESLSLAQAARASGGKVIVQVKNVAKAGTLPPRLVRIPCTMVDAVVVCSDPQKYHRQICETYQSPVFAGHLRVPMQSLSTLPLDEKKVIARRAILELQPHAVVNLGIGAPEAVAAVAAEEGIIEKITLTVESGAVGGMPSGGANFGVATNQWAMIDHIQQFDFYDSGGLDATFLGMAEADQQGNVNVSQFGNKVIGVGGFTNISQNTRHVIFCGRFTGGKSRIEIGNGRVNIVQDGTEKKFVSQVRQITFSGAYASKNGQRVLYVTERCVFELRDGRLVLTEVAPGVDLEKDILSRMDFRPEIPRPPKLMNAAFFQAAPTGLLRSWLEK